MLGPDTIKAIETHKRNMRLAQSMRQERERQIRKMVRAGYGWEDLTKHPDPPDCETPRPWRLGLSREDARAAVLWGPK